MEKAAEEASNAIFQAKIQQHLSCFRAFHNSGIVPLFKPQAFAISFTEVFKIITGYVFKFGDRAFTFDWRNEGLDEDLLELSATVRYGITSVKNWVLHAYT